MGRLGSHETKKKMRLGLISLLSFDIKQDRREVGNKRERKKEHIHTHKLITK